jgi:hypothetical protein
MVTILMFWPGYQTNAIGFGLFFTLAIVQKFGVRKSIPAPAAEF